MFSKLKAFFSGRLNESGALPAIMAGAILISATGILLAGFSVTATRNAEINSIKTNVNYYLNACQSILEKETYKTLPSQFDSITDPAIKAHVADCTNPAASGTPVVSIYLVGEPTLYTPAGQTNATSVKVVLGVNVNKGSFQQNGYTQVVKYLSYPTQKDITLNSFSYISGFDANGNAIWVTP